MVMMTSVQSIKRKISASLEINQRLAIRDAVNLRILSPLISEKLILILGCQRSGNTLSFLMLNTHPKIKGLDETQSRFDFPTTYTMLNHRLQGYYTCSKLPEKTDRPDYIARNFPNSKILWIVRHPYSVISSMMALTNKDGSWIQKFAANNELRRHAALFPEILSLNLEELDDASLGAYVWKYKNLALNLHHQQNLHPFVFKYEDLLENPRQVTQNILEFVGLEWSDNVLNHDAFYTSEQKFAGGTKGSNPLNSSRKTPKLTLTDEQKEKIYNICQDQMLLYQYQ